MDFKNKTYKILLTGGGTGGSVAPLLAVAEKLETSPHPSPSKGEGVPLLTKEGIKGRFEFLWLGTKAGPERTMVASASSAQGVEIKFRAISSGKWRRYFSFKNLVDIFKIKIGFFQALWIILKWRPNLVMSAGSFVSVPVIWAAWVLRAPILIHQQDATPGLANKLMAPFARVVTVTFEKSLRDYGKKAVWTGNPVRQELRIMNHELRINRDLPVVLILGGGTGAMAINNLVEESLGELIKFCQVIHVTGKNRGKLSNELPSSAEATEDKRIMNYGKYEFLNAEQMVEAMKSADLAVTRAGMGFLSELSYLAKPAIIIPMPDSHQEENAAMFREAAIVLEQKSLNPVKFVNEIKNLIDNKDLRKELGEKMGRVMKSEANEAMMKIILEILK